MVLISYSFFVNGFPLDPQSTRVVSKDVVNDESLIYVSFFHAIMMREVKRSNNDPDNSQHFCFFLSIYTAIVIHDIFVRLEAFGIEMLNRHLFQWYINCVAMTGVFSDTRSKTVC